MKKTLLVILPLALIGAVLYVLWASGTDAPRVAERSNTSEASGLESGLEGAVIPDAEADRVPITSAAMEPGATTDVVTIRGRTVTGEDASPLAGCTVALGGRLSSDSILPVEQRPVWSNPDPIVTGDDGTFAFRFPAHPDYIYSVTSRAEGRVAMQTTRTDLRGGIVDLVDLGDVVMGRGTRVEGVIVYEDGDPATDVRLSLSQRELRTTYVGLWNVLDGGRTYGTDAAGNLEWPEWLAPGTWQVGVSRRRELIEPEFFHVEEGQEVAQLRVVVASPRQLPGIYGIVVDEDGRPVPRVGLRAESPDGEFTGNTGSSTADGSFVIQHVREQEGPVRVRVIAGGFQQIGEVEPQEWGSTVQVVVREHPDLRIRAVEAESRRAVENYAIRLIPPGSMSERVRYSGNHPDGFLEVPRVAPGSYRLFVLPSDPKLVATEPVEIEVPGADPDFVIGVHRRLPLTIHVIGTDGAPWAGTEVELLRGVNVRTGWGLELRSPTGLPEVVHSSLSGTAPIGVLMDSGVTDGEGLVHLTGPPSDGSLYVKVKGPGHIPLLQSGVSISPSSPPLTVRVQAGARLVGSAAPLDFIRRLQPDEEVMAQVASVEEERRSGFLMDYSPTLRLSPQDRSPGVFELVAILGEDGRFVLEGVPPGDSEIEVRLRRPVQEWSGYQDVDLGTVSGLRDGETREIDLDLSPFVFGRLRGTILMDGAPYLGNFGLIRTQPSTRASGGMEVRGYAQGLLTDGDGGFDLAVDPGLYNVWAEHGEDAREGKTRLTALEQARVDPGSDVRQVFHLVHSHMRVRLLEHDGAPAVQRKVEVHTRGYPMAVPDLIPDKDGWFTVDSPPGLPVRLSTWPKGMDQRATLESVNRDDDALIAARIPIGEFRIPDGETTAQFEVTLPAGR